MLVILAHGLLKQEIDQEFQTSLGYILSGTQGTESTPRLREHCKGGTENVRIARRVERGGGGTRL